MTIEQSELREKIKREIRIAMAQELLEGTFRERQDHRERIANLHVGTIMEMIEPTDAALPWERDDLKTALRRIRSLDDKNISKSRAIAAEALGAKP
jgi:hypothetical protein